MASSAAESGIYYLKLASDTGSWNERVLNATGAPPRDANAFTAIVCTIVLTTSSEGAENAVTAIKDAATKVFEPPKPRIKLPPVAMPPEPPPPELPEPEEPPENEWKSVTVADIFPGVRNTTLGASSKVARIVEQLSGGIEDFQAKKQDLEQLVSETQSLVDTLASTGTYAFLAAPETTPSADWYERMTSISEENGRPPFNPSLYSSGTVTVVTASNYFELLSRFSKITSAINTSI
ncbi:MAG: hypothetical protein IBX50_04200 [Marinospirillum sp.]|uniref:hypothetical protein n=1 Tax=Marinospirillum sp. TaxID=2183934 RepID=UPI0019EAAB46|nr:hypothetical protein [Marinospirillum sp.]MBE0505908.1 hypothetical protein [Marinospirillum sp.]